MKQGTGHVFLSKRGLSLFIVSNRTVAKKIKWGNIFSLDLPEAWIFHEEDGVVALFDEEHGVGAMQVSFAQRTSKQDPTRQEAVQLALDYASQRGWNISMDSINVLTVDGYPASEFSLEENTDGQLGYWHVWHIMGKGRVAFMTYNCLAAQKAAEVAPCDLAVCSFRWE